MSKSFLLYEILGIIFIVILGSILHFTFELSGNNKIVALFSAVNESVWEHLKLGFWPALLYAIIEYRRLKSANNFLFAKAVGIYLIPISIVVLFYFYTAFIEDNLVMDILIFVIAVIIGQLTSYKLLNMRRMSVWLEKTSLVALIILGILFVVFTFYPPQLHLFMDPISGKYGI
jgi:hypothetical protein